MAWWAGHRASIRTEQRIAQRVDLHAKHRVDLLITTAALLFDEGEAREKDVLKYLTQGQIRLELCRDLL